MSKKRKSSILSVFICFVLLLSLTSGCSTAKNQTSPAAASGGKQTITDMVGNQVTIPTTINKVYCTSPIGTYILYTLAPDKLLGWNTDLNDQTKPFIAEKYRNLPSLGGTMGGQNTFNVEAITALKPDIILDFAYNQQVPDMVKQLGQQTGIPVVEMDSALKATPDSYRLLGKVLGNEARGNELADYAQKMMDNVSSMVAKVPDSEKVKIYYAESADGLMTDGSDSMHTEVIDYLKASNVVTMDTSASGKGAKVSMEQVVNWNPDVIIANVQMGGSDFVKSVYNDPTWAGINAVKNHRIYMPASLPFNWFDRPPCIARIFGVEWLGCELYPNYVNVDLKTDLKSFYKEFYGVDVSDDQANALIAGTVAK